LESRLHRLVLAPRGLAQRRAYARMNWKAVERILRNLDIVLIENEVAGPGTGDTLQTCFSYICFLPHKTLELGIGLGRSARTCTC
jgi:hypothetical protein